MNNKKRVIGIVAGVLLLLIIALSINQYRKNQRILDSEDVATSTDSLNRQNASNKTVRPRTEVNKKPSITDLSGEGEAIREKNIEDLNKLDVDFSLVDADLLNPDVVAQLLEKYGSYPELYRVLSEDQRQQLIDFLQLKNELRDHIGPILAMEENSDLRTFMLFRVMPNSFGINGGGDLLDTTDRELISILDQPTLSDISPNEWIARMQLANLVDAKYALNWTRDAGTTYPEDLQVNVTAATLTMKIGATVDSVTTSERDNAEKYLTTSLLSEKANEIAPDDRISAYYSLFWSTDGSKSLDFYRQRLEQETDSKAKGILQGLISMLEEKN